MKISDLRVLELSSVLAGPQTASFFAELGAKVIKVENPKSGGDLTRKWKIPGEDREQKVSAYYASANTYKEVVYLDLTAPEGLREVQKLIGSSDLVISNFKKGDDVKFGLSFKDLKKINPNIILGEITGFGPESDRLAFDVVLQAETGYISMTGNPGERPAKLPVAFIDLFAAHQLKEGLLLALLEGERPRKVSVSLYDSAIASLANQGSNYLMEGHVAQPMGTAHPNIAPYGDMFYTSDNKIMLFAVGNNKQFLALLDLLKLELLPEFDSNEKRVQKRSELNSYLSTEIARWTRDELLAECHGRNIPAGAVYDLAEVFAQEKAGDLVIRSEQEGRKTKKVKTAVFTLSS